MPDRHENRYGRKVEKHTMRLVAGRSGDVNEGGGGCCSGDNACDGDVIMVVMVVWVVMVVVI